MEAVSESTESPRLRPAGTANEFGSPENAVGELISVAVERMALAIRHQSSCLAKKMRQDEIVGDGCICVVYMLVFQDSVCCP